MWNPHYLEYCESQGYPGDPEGMLEHDRKQYPGGKMAGFIAWHLEQLSTGDGQNECQVRKIPLGVSAGRGLLIDQDRAKELQNPSGLDPLGIGK